jgi:hypothetical protein
MKKKITLTVFFITILSYSLFMNRLFAVPAEFKAIKEMEAAQGAKPLPSLRPPTEYTAEKLRDPFQGVKIEGEEKAPEITASTALPPSLTIQGLVWGGSFPQAIINNKVFKAGDMIEGCRIIDINKGGVTIFFGGRQYNIDAPSTVNLQSIGEKPKGGKDEE